MHFITLRGPCLAAATALLTFSGSAPTNASASKPGTVIATQNGMISGVTAEGVRVFRGIPFAAPPVGALRWKAPQPAMSWRGVRKASAWGPACPQPASRIPKGQRMAEDCLYLNVWTPAKRTSRRTAVMVWIHGGNFTSGSGSFPEFNGTDFARNGVILVTLNYRLGPLGFFAHPALTGEAPAQTPLGNYGLMDQLAALKWVKRNIAAFGGDPDNVTLFGESSGAEAVVHLLTMGASRGLFEKAIVESAPAFTPEKSLASEEQEGAKLAASAGAPASPTADQLRALSSDKLIAAGATSTIAPFVDGRLVTEPPMRAIARGEWMRVPMIIGSNSDEGSLVDEGFRDVPRMIMSFLPRPAAERARQIYGAVSSDDNRFGRESFGDLIFGSSARWIAAQQSRRSPTFLYRYSYVWAADRGRVPGAGHAAELLMVFNTLNQHHGQVSAADWSESRLINNCWLSFAKTGTPACPGAQQWPAYDAGRDAIMEFGSSGLRLESDHRKPQLDFWQPVGLQLSGAMPAR